MKNNYQFEWIDSITSVEHSEWRSLAFDEYIQMTPQYFEILEKSFSHCYQFIYLKVFSKNELLAIFPFFLDKSFYLGTPLTGRLSNYARIIKKLLIKKALIYGSPISEYNCMCFKESTEKDLENLLTNVLSEIKRFARKNKVKIIIFKDIKCHFFSNYEYVLLSDKYGKYYSLPGTIFKNQFSNFEDYLFSLQKKRRQNIKNKINKFTKIKDAEVVITTDFAPYIDEIYELYLQTFEKAKFKYEKLEKSYFEHMNNIFGENSKLILVYYKQKIVGYTLLLKNTNSIINVRIGIDYTAPQNLQIYYIMLYENIKYALNENIQEILLSQTSYRPKLELGAEIIPLHLFVKFISPKDHIIYSWLLRKFLLKHELLSTSKKPLEVVKKYFS